MLAGEPRPRQRNRTHYTYLPMPDHVKELLREVQELLKEEAERAGLCCANLDHAHLTLAVFKLNEERKRDDEDELIRRTNAVLRDFLHETQPNVTLSFTGLSSFDHRNVHVTVQLTDELDDLWYDSNERLEADGIQVYDNSFKPHVTLFKIREDVVQQLQGQKQKQRMKEMTEQLYNLVDDFEDRCSLPQPITVDQILFDRLNN